MSKKTSVSTAPDQREVVLGLLYLLFQQLILPRLLTLANEMLNYPWSSARLELIYFLINFLAVLLLFHDFLGRSLIHLGKHLISVLAAAFLGFCAYYVCNLALTQVLLRFFPDFSNVNDARVQFALELDFLPTALATVALVPMTEEVLYRSVVFRSLYYRNRFAAYALSTVLFCVIHVMGYMGQAEPLTLLLSAAQYVPASLCLAWAYAKADNIFAPILIHTIINAMGIMAVR